MSAGNNPWDNLAPGEGKETNPAPVRRPERPRYAGRMGILIIVLLSAIVLFLALMLLGAFGSVLTSLPVAR